MLPRQRRVSASATLHRKDNQLVENETLRFWILENDRANLYLEAGRQERLGFDDAPWPPRQYAANLAALMRRVVYIAGMKDGSPWAGANLPVRRPARA